MTVSDHDGSRPVVVVGFDGSPASRAAVAHAIDLVGTTGQLHIVTAYAVPDDFVGASYYTFAHDDARDAALETLNGLRADEPRLAEVSASDHVVLGAPAVALEGVATEVDADAIVVGTRGLGRLRGLIGSVAHDLLHQADRPVVVIPARMLARLEGRATAEIS